MATMLTYILTDLDVPRAKLQQLLSETSSSTFNCISVDGDQSTSDTAVLISSKHFSADGVESIAEFSSALDNVCQTLAEDIVRNGEGTQHVIKVRVMGIKDRSAARKIGKSVVNSNLVKCAISGCDPNVGRIVGAIGSCVGNYLSETVRNEDVDLNQMRVVLGGKEIFSRGAFQLDPQTETYLSDYMYNCQLFPKDVPEHDRTYPPHERSVELDVFFGNGDESTAVLVIGSDLSEEYVEVNADYRS